MNLKDVIPQVEIEGGELLEAPDGTQKKYKGKSHKNGGIDLAIGDDLPLTDETAPEGTNVFSPKTTIFNPELGKVEDMVTRKKRRDKENKKSHAKYKKLNKLFDEDPSNLNKKTLARQKTATEAILGRNQQEESQDVEFMDALSQLQKYMYGGNINHTKGNYGYGGKMAYPTGGKIDFDPNGPKRDTFTDKTTGKTLIRRGDSYFESDKAFGDITTDDNSYVTMEDTVRDTDGGIMLDKRNNFNLPNPELKGQTFNEVFDVNENNLVPLEQLRERYHPNNGVGGAGDGPEETIDVKDLDLKSMGDIFDPTLKTAPVSKIGQGATNSRVQSTQSNSIPQPIPASRADRPAEAPISPLPNPIKPLDATVAPPEIPTEGGAPFDDALGAGSDSSNPFMTKGDKMGLTGTAVAGAIPSLLTIINRAGDDANINPYKQFGKDGLEANADAQQHATTSLERGLEANNTAANTVKQANRRGARSSNTLRNLDIAAFNGQQRAAKGLIGQYEDKLSQLFSQKAGQEDQQDKYYMKGEDDRMIRDKQDRDAFFSNLSANAVDAGSALQHSGKTLNQLQSNQDFLDILPALNKHGYGFTRNKDGRLILNSTK